MKLNKAAIKSPPSRRSNESSFKIKRTRSEVVGILRIKAAMFGLDARIALAIFGALSVISGAALYSAIQNARATALITELNEIGKAYEQFYLDTGATLTPQAAIGYARSSYESKELVENPGVDGWKGPYLSYLIATSNTNVLRYPGKDEYHINIMTIKDVDWTDWTANVCTEQPNCYIWIQIGYFPESYNSTVIKMDEMLDNSDGAGKGKLRFLGADGKHIYYKYAPLFN